MCPAVGRLPNSTLITYLIQRAGLYHAIQEQSSGLLAGCAACVFFHIHQDQQYLGNCLQAKEVKNAGQRLHKIWDKNIDGTQECHSFIEEQTARILSDEQYK